MKRVIALSLHLLLVLWVAGLRAQGKRIGIINRKKLLGISCFMEKTARIFADIQG